jgi:hypothetical protein
LFYTSLLTEGIDMSDFEFGIDIENVPHPRSFVLGVLWTVRAIGEVNNNVRRDMFQFDGSERADGAAMVVEKQNEALKAIERFVQVALGVDIDDEG